jgi:hypothetical protein
MRRKGAHNKTKEEEEGEAGLVQNVGDHANAPHVDLLVVALGVEHLRGCRGPTTTTTTRSATTTTTTTRQVWKLNVQRVVGTTATDSKKKERGRLTMKMEVSKREALRYQRNRGFRRRSASSSARR